MFCAVTTHLLVYNSWLLDVIYLGWLRCIELSVNSMSYNEGETGLRWVLHAGECWSRRSVWRCLTIPMIRATERKSCSNCGPKIWCLSMALLMMIYITMTILECNRPTAGLINWDGSWGVSYCINILHYSECQLKTSFNWIDKVDVGHEAKRFPRNSAT